MKVFTFVTIKRHQRKKDAKRQHEASRLSFIVLLVSSLEMRAASINTFHSRLSTNTLETCLLRSARLEPFVGAMRILHVFRFGLTYCHCIRIEFSQLEKKTLKSCRTLVSQTSRAPMFCCDEARHKRPESLHNQQWLQPHRNQLRTWSTITKKYQQLLRFSFKLNNVITQVCFPTFTFGAFHLSTTNHVHGANPNWFHDNDFYPTNLHRNR